MNARIRTAQSAKNVEELELKQRNQQKYGKDYFSSKRILVRLNKH